MPSVALVVASVVILKGACDPRPPCERAEDALNAAAAECGEAEWYDLSCDSMGHPNVDCSEYYLHMETTARCVDGEVEVSYDAMCAGPALTGPRWWQTLVRLNNLWDAFIL